MRKFLLASCLLLSLALSQAMAQDRTVTGVITSSEDGTKLPGVNVVLKGSTVGTVTDVDGKYRLTIPSAGGTLVFSFIGLTTQEAEVGERSVVDIQMKPDVTQLGEVIVTAAGIERERSATITTSRPLPPRGASGTAAISVKRTSISTRT